MHIISLVPSLTEFLFDLDLDDEIIGITNFCIHPKEKVSKKEKIGGTKTLNIQKIINLKPDLIIANKEENSKDDILKLKEIFPEKIFITDIKNLDDCWSQLTQLGIICNRENKAKDLIKSIKKDWEKLHNYFPPLKFTYLIWRNPYMTIGKNTFIHAVLTHLGFVNAFSEKVSDTNYPMLTKEEIENSNSDILFLSSEPYSFSQKHFKEFISDTNKAKTICLLIDGEMTSWYGSRLKYALKYFNSFKNNLN